MKRKLLLLVGVVVLLGVALLIVRYEYVHSNQSSDTVKIGALLPQTGSGANYGKSLKQGIDLAVSEINSSGGINNKKLEVIYADSKTDPKEGVTAFNKLVDVDKTPLVIGSISGVILAVQPIADEKHVVLLNTSAISPKICDKADNYLFSIMVKGSAEASFAAREIAGRYPKEAVAILYSNNSSGSDTKDVFIKDLEASGNKVAIAESYELNSTDFRTQLSKIKESNAKVGYLIAFSSDEFANILKQSKELGLGLQWYSYSGFETKETLDLAKNASEGVIYSYPSYDPSASLMNDFQRGYGSAYGGAADIYAATSYEGVKLIASVMRTNGVTSSDIQRGLRNAPTFKGIFGDVKFGQKQCVEDKLIWKTVKDGQYRVYQT